MKPRNLEIANQIAARLEEVRSLAARVQDLKQEVPVGSEIARGLRLAHDDLNSASHHLERIQQVARMVIV